MRSFSADVEISAPIYIKAQGLKAYIEQTNKLDGVGIDLLFEKRSFNDIFLGDTSRVYITFASCFTVMGLWHGATLTDHGPTKPPEDDERGTGYRLYESTARMAETVYVDAIDIEAASEAVLERLGTTFEFDQKNEEIFNKPPISRKGAPRISFGAHFVLHRRLEYLEEC